MMWNGQNNLLTALFVVVVSDRGESDLLYIIAHLDLFSQCCRLGNEDVVVRYVVVCVCGVRGVR